MSRFNRGLNRAIRSLWHTPSVTMIAIGTLALGIGATSALYSVLDPVLLRPLPYADPEALVAIQPMEDGGATEDVAGALTLDVIESFGAEPDLFDAVGGWRSWSPILTALGEPAELSGVEATQGFLPEVLGVQPMLGRSFLPEEHRSDGTRTVILSHAFWMDRMGGDPGVLGRSLTLDALPFTIVGVMPPRFRAPSPGSVTVWTSARREGPCGATCPRYRAIARLRGGLTLALANDRAAALAGRVAETRPPGEVATSARLVPLRSALLGSASRVLALLATAVALALLAACVNVAALQRVRAASRRREFRVREALGAGRGAIAWLWLAETGTLALFGGGLGLLMALWGTELLTALAPPGLPAVPEARLNGRVLGFTAAAAFLTALVSGLAPALREPADGPRAGPTGPGSWLRLAVIGQVGASMVLLVGTGLLLRSLHELNSEHPGVTTDGVVAVRVEPPAASQFDPRAAPATLDSLLARMQSRAA